MYLSYCAQNELAFGTNNYVVSSSNWNMTWSFKLVRHSDRMVMQPMSCASNRILFHPPVFAQVNSHSTIVPQRDFVCYYKSRVIPEMVYFVLLDTWWDWTAATQISLFHPVRWDRGLWYHRTAVYRCEVSSDNFQKNVRGHRYVI